MQSECHPFRTPALHFLPQPLTQPGPRTRRMSGHLVTPLRNRREGKAKFFYLAASNPMNIFYMKRLLLLAAVAAAMVSCQKEVSFDSSTGGGSGGGSDTYQPVTKGSFWKYKDSALTGYTTLMTSTGQQKTIGTKTYYVFTSETTGQAAQEGYFYAAKPVYGLRTDIPGGLGTLDYVHLNDTASVGYTWTDNMGQINGLASRFTGTIMERNITKQVAGKDFTNVIHTRLILEYELPFFGWTEVGVYQYYIAKNVGIIRIESDLGFSGATTRTVLDLIDYSIK
jgi:hypothetical protein